MAGKIALVTGGTGGIGTAICRRLAEDGYTTVAGYFSGGDHDRARKWQARQQEDGLEIGIVFGDVADYASSMEMMVTVRELFGEVDVLVNNAGITRDATMRKMKPGQWQDVVRTNLDSAFNVTHQVINSMIDRGWGRVINISSINGEKGQFGQVNYSAAKAGILGFTRALAQEGARKGVTVNAICPGYIETEMTAKMPEEVLESIRAGIPVGRLGTPAEVARLVSFLADEQSAFITGAAIDINGGQLMH